MDTVAVLSWLGIGINLLLYASGIPACYQFYLDKSTGNTSSFPFLCMLLSSIYWLVYGVFVNNPVVWQLNILGVVMQLFYLLLFVYYVKPRRFVIRQLQLMTLFGSAVLFAIIYAFFSYPNEAIQVMGIVCNILTIITCGAPLSTVSEVIQTKNTSSMTPSICITCFLSSVIWWLYGYAIHDIFLQIPNAVGTVLGLFQIALFLIYPRQ